MTSLKTSIKTITYLSDIGCLEIQGASLIGIIFCQRYKFISDVFTFENICAVAMVFSPYNYTMFINIMVIDYICS